MAKLWLGVALLFGVLASLAAVAIRAELFSPGVQVLPSRADYSLALSLHATLALLAATAAFLGLARLTVPARTRFDLLALGAFVIGGVIMTIGLLRHQPASFGWFAYAPLPETSPSVPGQGLLRFGHVVNGLGLIVSCACLIITGLRTTRRTFLTWTVLVAAALIAGSDALNLPGVTAFPTRLEQVTLALPFLGVILHVLWTGSGVARGWAVAGLVTVAVTLVVHLRTAMTDSYSDVSVSHGAGYAVVVFGLFAGLYTWWPRLFGRALDERPGWSQLGLFFVGYQLTFVTFAWLGQWGMPRRYADYLPQDGFTTGQRTSTAGTALLLISAALFLVLTLPRPTRTPSPHSPA